MFGLSGSVLAALLSVYVFWGGTYLAARFAIETMPPTAMAGMRFLISGILMYAWEYTQGLERTGWKEWRDAAVVGFFMLFLANGGVVWAQQFVPSGLAAIILGMTPLWLVLLNWLWQKGPRPNGLVGVGLALGFTGIALLAQDAATGQGGNYFFGSCILVASSLFWALGSLYSRTACQPKRPLQGVAMQMLSGGFALCVVAAFMGQWRQVNLDAVSMKSLAAFMYLIFCGSFLGFGSYIWLLKKAPTSIVATYAYVNPLVAVCVGWLFAGETLGMREAMAAAVIIVAVFLITVGNTRRSAAELSRREKTNT